MLRFVAGAACFLFIVGLAASAPDIQQAGTGGGEKSNKAAPAKKVDNKVIAEVHEGEKHVERKYDLSNPRQLEALVHALQEGHVEELKKDVPPKLIDLARWDLGVWSLVIFLVLVAILGKFAWKPMLAGLHKREENIRGALEQAERTRREALELQTKLDAQMKDAGGKIAALMEEARRDAQGVKDKMVTEARNEIQQERDRLRHEIEVARDQALSELWQQTVQLSALVSTRAIRKHLTVDDHRQLVDEALAELPKAADSRAKFLAGERL